MPVDLGQDRVPTGIGGFDDLIEGGFPRGSLVLLAGNTGAGKTVFSAQYMYHGASRLGEPGVYVSFAENRETLIKNMKRMNMDFEKFEQEGKVRFLDLVTVKEEGVQKTIETILQVVKSLKAKRLVIDSFTALAQSLSEEIDARIIMHTILGKITRLMGITVLLISEKPIGFESQAIGMEEFVSDGIITQNAFTEKGYLRRTMQVIKMRGTKINSNQHSFDIDEHGIRLWPNPEIRVIEKVFTERISTGIEDLDRMLKGGLLKGSASLVVGGGGTGKTTASLHFILKGAMRNEKGLYISFSEPVQQIVKQSEGFGWGLKKFLDNGLITLVTISFEPPSIEQLYFQTIHLLQDLKPARVVIESISHLESILSEDKYIRYIRSLVSYLKSEGVTSLFTSSAEVSTPTTDARIRILMDNVIWLRDVELGRTLTRSLTILKARNIEHDRDIRQFEITNRGIVVRKKFVGK